MIRFCPMRKLWYVWLDRKEAFWSHKPGSQGQEECQRWLEKNLRVVFVSC